MTTFLAFLDHLTALDWLFIAIGWLLVAYALGTFTGLGIALSDKRKPEPAPVFRIISLYPPEVPTPVTPPFSQVIPDASWFDGMPVEILSDEAVHSLFDRLINLDDNLRDLA